MAKSAGYYNVDDFNDYKRKQGKCLPPRINILAAACHIQELFDAKNFTYGFMGGLSMLCLGYKREMPDLHVAYNDKDFKRLKSKLENDRRVRLPTGMNSLLPFKILVWTGPEYKDQGCSINASIELDLVPSCTCGTPGAGDLTRSLVLLGLKTTSGRQMIFKSLNTQYLLATLLSYCKARDLSWDPRKDILYLCKNEEVEVQRIHARLNVKEVKEMFLGTSFFTRLHVQDQRRCYRTLLDTEPPPIMAITPPAPQPVASIHAEERLPKQLNDLRAPRSRYRNAGGQRSSSDGTTEHEATRDARPQSMDRLRDPRSATNIQGIQCVNSAKPHAVSAATAAIQARNSMPNLLDPRNTTLASSRKPATQQHLQNHSLPSNEGCGSSQLDYGGGYQPAHMRATSDGAVNNQVNSLGQGTMTSRTDSTRTESTGTPVQGIQSQKGSLHIVSPEGEVVPRQQYFEEKSASPRGRLHLIGPEGVYGVPKNLQQPAQPLPQHQIHSSAPPPQMEPTFVFELDATAPLKPAFITELSAESIKPAQAHVTHYKGTADEQDTVKPSNCRTSSAPSEAVSLPASLVAGGLGLHTNRQSISHNGVPDEVAFGFSTRQTNAYRYSTYSVPQSTYVPASPASFEEATGPTYKPYRPFIATDQPHRMDSVSSVYSPGHKRNVSNDSTASHESDKLAKEYQELLNFEDGYGSN